MKPGRWKCLTSVRRYAKTGKMLLVWQKARERVRENAMRAGEELIEKLTNW